MKNAKSNGDINYKETIKAENKRFNYVNLKARQKKVVAKIMEDLKNNEEGGTEQMKGGVKQAVKVKKTANKKVVPPKVDVKKIKEKAIFVTDQLLGLAKEKTKGLQFAKVETASYVGIKIGRLIPMGCRYSKNGLVLFFARHSEEFAKQNISAKTIKNSERPCYALNEYTKISDFKKIAEFSIEQCKLVVKKVKAVAKVVAKKAVKKNKEIKRTI